MPEVGRVKRIENKCRDIIGVLSWHRPRYAPEWGSGGIFGLKYHNGYLYYTLAFEALSFFISNDDLLVYDFNIIGSPPRSGGDTYNAVEAVDDSIFFGGWVHAPVVYKGKEGRKAEISFQHKYSHIHEFNVEKQEIRLLWMDSIHHDKYWAGEVSDILYDPVNDKLLVARGDGHKRLGIYALDRGNNGISLIDDSVALKGELHLDYACFGIRQTPESGSYVRAAPEITCIDLYDYRVIKSSLASNGYVDGDGPRTPDISLAASIYSRFYAFQRGGVIHGDPVENELIFTRLYDMPGRLVGPVRTKVVYINGGVLVSYNSFSEATLGDSKKIGSPSLLLYITPPIARVVGVFGARITSIESLGDKVILATNTNANLTRRESTPIDVGTRGFTVLSHDNLLSTAPQPYRIRMSLSKLHQENALKMPRIYGGIPMSGYRNAVLNMKCEGTCRIKVYSYDMSTHPGEADEDVYTINNTRGVSKLILEGYGSSIISFEFEGRIKSDIIVDVF